MDLQYFFSIHCICYVNLHAGNLENQTYNKLFNKTQLPVLYLIHHFGIFLLYFKINRDVVFIFTRIDKLQDSQVLQIHLKKKREKRAITEAILKFNVKRLIKKNCLNSKMPLLINLIVKFFSF